MAVIETKFGVGDVVWHATISTVTRQHPCPDCLGSREWKAESPAGGVFSFSCPRCSTSFRENHAMSLSYSQWAASARRLTIGQVRAYSGPDGKNEYMCLETGVGSGTIYDERRLFANEADALKAAETMAAVENANQDGWVAKQYAETIKLCDYQLKDAEIDAAKSTARQARLSVGYLVDDLDDAISLDDVKTRIAAWREDSQ